MKNILERMKETPLVFDGAMGTMIYSKGVFINTCYDELCLTSPKIIQEIHREYVEALVDVIETNTFGANRIKLRKHGLVDKTVEINRRAVELAREIAGETVYLAGSVGPCLRLGQRIETENQSEIEDAFEEQIRTLTDCEVDFILLETFSGLQELQLAAEIARRRGKPVFASVTVDEDGISALGSRIEDLVRVLDADENVDGVGMNCGVGPAAAYDNLKRALPATDKPFMVMPNAGLPREVDGRMIYLTSPEYFTEYAKKFIELGVRAVGGCCGTTPEHISQAAKAVKSLSGVKKHVEIQVYTHEEPEVEVVPLEMRSRMANKLSRGEPVTSIEILPPKSTDLSSMLEKAKKCFVYGVDALNIPDGPRASSRITTMVAALSIKDKVGIETVIHYCCRDRNLIGMQSDLMGAHAAGLANVLIVTGDPPKLGEYPEASGVFDVDSIGLTQVAANLNHGRDIGGNRINPPTALVIGVGANPVAVDPAREIERYFRKIDAGAEFAITQPIFDPEALFRFLDRVEEYGRSLPIIAGIWPLTSYKNAEFMNNEVPGVKVPEETLERMRRTGTREEGRLAGIEIAREICEAISERVNGFQVSAPFGNVDTALKVLGKLPME